MGDEPWNEPGVKAPEIAVERVFKGDPNATTIAFIAQPIDVCDESSASSGDRGLFFLGCDPWRSGLRAMLADACRRELLERVLTVGGVPAGGESLAIRVPMRCSFELTLHASSGARRCSIRAAGE